eukprot:COSAG02_NODE_4480_length_5314_cov_6.582167_7_plen_48_part_00
MRCLGLEEDDGGRHLGHMAMGAQVAVCKLVREVAHKSETTLAELLNA